MQVCWQLDHYNFKIKLKVSNILFTIMDVLHKLTFKYLPDSAVEEQKTCETF